MLYDTYNIHFMCNIYTGFMLVYATARKQINSSRNEQKRKNVGSKETRGELRNTIWDDIIVFLIISFDNVDYRGFLEL